MFAVPTTDNYYQAHAQHLQANDDLSIIIITDSVSVRTACSQKVEYAIHEHNPVTGAYRDSHRGGTLLFRRQRYSVHINQLLSYIIITVTICSRIQVEQRFLTRDIFHPGRWYLLQNWPKKLSKPISILTMEQIFKNCKCNCQ